MAETPDCCDGVSLPYWLKGPCSIPGEANFFSSQTFVMDKERTMRSYGAQPPMRALKARSNGTRPSPHNRAGTLASIYINIRIYIYHFAWATSKAPAVAYN